ncbi:MAG: NADH-quinone oxidoreductase subunit D [Deltaproteobacteria bacterium]|nr:NADH-quinone oxidoreductase subunit D [Deltaproteobacteria bacterium]
MSETSPTSADRARDAILLNMGPQHPSTHGVLRFVLHTDGEIMHRAVPEVGYLHRGLEKLAEQQTWAAYMPFTDRINYMESMFCNQAWAMAVERLAGIEVPERAEFLRVIACELNRIANHHITLGCMSMDVGAFTPFTYLLRERETINDLMEALCGNRLTYNYMRIGGVAHDVDRAWIAALEKFLDHFEPICDELDSLISYNEILVKRFIEVGVICQADAVAWGLVGPNLRASGVSWDLRRDQPYSVYPRFDFDVPTAAGARGIEGDCFRRWLVRAEEMRQSCRILRQAIAALPEGEIRAKVPRKLKPPAGEVYACVEGARGELGVYAVSDGSDRPYRAKWRSSSFSALSIIEHISPGLMIADLVAVVASLDTIAPEMDR